MGYKYRVIFRTIYLADLELKMNELGKDGFKLVVADDQCYIFEKAE